MPTTEPNSSWFGLNKNGNLYILGTFPDFDSACEVADATDNCVWIFDGEVATGWRDSLHTFLQQIDTRAVKTDIPNWFCLNKDGDMNSLGEHPSIAEATNRAELIDGSIWVIDTDKAREWLNSLNTFLAKK